MTELAAVPSSFFNVIRHASSRQRPVILSILLLTLLLQPSVQAAGAEVLDQDVLALIQMNKGEMHIGNKVDPDKKADSKAKLDSAQSLREGPTLKKADNDAKKANMESTSDTRDGPTLKKADNDAKKANMESTSDSRDGPTLKKADNDAKKANMDAAGSTTDNGGTTETAAAKAKVRSDEEDGKVIVVNEKVGAAKADSEDCDGCAKKGPSKAALQAKVQDNAAENKHLVSGKSEHAHPHEGSEDEDEGAVDRKVGVEADAVKANAESDGQDGPTGNGTKPAPQVIEPTMPEGYDSHQTPSAFPVGVGFILMCFCFCGCCFMAIFTQHLWKPFLERFTKEEEPHHHDGDHDTTSHTSGSHTSPGTTPPSTPGVTTPRKTG